MSCAICSTGTGACRRPCCGRAFQIAALSDARPRSWSASPTNLVGSLGIWNCIAARMCRHSSLCTKASPIPGPTSHSGTGFALRSTTTGSWPARVAPGCICEAISSGLPRCLGFRLDWLNADASLGERLTANNIRRQSPTIRGQTEGERSRPIRRLRRYLALIRRPAFPVSKKRLAKAPRARTSGPKVTE